MGGILVCGGTVAYHQGSEGNAIAGAPVAIQERIRVRRIRPLNIGDLIVNGGIRNSNIATSGNNPMERTLDRAVLNVQCAGDIEQNGRSSSIQRRILEGNRYAVILRRCGIGGQPIPSILTRLNIAAVYLQGGPILIDQEGIAIAGIIDIIQHDRTVLSHINTSIAAGKLQSSVLK